MPAYKTTNTPTMPIKSPIEVPPANGQSSAATVESQPQVLSDAELKMMYESGGGAAAPELVPPSMEKAAAVAAAAWVNGVHVNALWSIDQNRNSWAGFPAGWKKFANNSDTAIVAFTILASHAKQTQGPVNYREEADGMIHEMYVF